MQNKTKDLLALGYVIALVIVLASTGFALATETLAPLSVHLLGSFIFGGWIGYVTLNLRDRQ